MHCLHGVQGNNSGLLEHTRMRAETLLVRLGMAAVTAAQLQALSTGIREGSVGAPGE